MRQLNIHEAKTNLSAVLMAVEQKGETFLICRNGKPIAELVPQRQTSRLPYHPVLSNIQINYNPVEDVSDEEWGEIE